jgi:hypothetical protein
MLKCAYSQIWITRRTVNYRLESILNRQRVKSRRSNGSWQIRICLNILMMSAIDTNLCYLLLINITADYLTAWDLVVNNHSGNALCMFAAKHQIHLEFSVYLPSLTLPCDTANITLSTRTDSCKEYFLYGEAFVDPHYRTVVFHDTRIAITSTMYVLQ